ncbi:hypothetical protein [Fodinicola feengrottensis]
MLGSLGAGLCGAGAGVGLCGGVVGGGGDASGVSVEPGCAGALGCAAAGV